MGVGLLIIKYLFHLINNLYIYILDYFWDYFKQIRQDSLGDVSIILKNHKTLL